MNKIIYFCIAVVLAAIAYVVYTGQAGAQSADATVNFTMKARMPTLEDPAKTDHFEITIADHQLLTKLQFDCTAGRTEMFLIEHPKTCTFPAGGTSSTSLLLKGAPVMRTQFGGYYTVASDGTAKADKLNATYLQVGKASAGQANFSGVLKLKPKLTSSGAEKLTQTILGRLQGESGQGPVNKAVDTIDLNQFCIPSMGRPSDDPGVCITGNLVYPYQNASWYQKLAFTFKGKTYDLIGNMPYVDAVDAAGNEVTDPKYLAVTEYNATLTVPETPAGGDDALFSSSGDDEDFLASVDGIVCKITMKNNNEVPVVVQGEATTGYTDIDATGSCTGTNVPVEVVRAYLFFIALNPTTFFGA